MKNMLNVFKKFFSYKWNINFISTIFRNEKMETISEGSFKNIDNGCLTVSNSFFVKLVCSVIIIIATNIKTINIDDLNSVLAAIKSNWFVPTLFLLMVIVPNFIIYITKKNRYIKRYPKLYYSILIIVLISLIEVIFSLIYFISNFDSTRLLFFSSIIGLIANFATFYGYISIQIGIIDFCVYTNKIALNKENSKNTDFGDYIDYF